MLLKTAFIICLATSAAFADKLPKAVEKTTKEVELPADLITSETQKVNIKEVKKADERSDTIDEKSDVYEAPSANYEAGTQVSQGNLYYYYYPVAAYPVHASDKVSSASSSSASSLTDSPLIFLLVPLVLLLIAVPVVAFFVQNNNARSFGPRSSDLDEKFGSFAELQAAIDAQLAKYMTALDSDDCMDRIVCELGVKASNIPHKNLFFSVVEWLAPEHGLLGYGRMTVLKQAASGKYTMDSCKKYTCNPPASIQQLQK